MLVWWLHISWLPGCIHFIVYIVGVHFIHIHCDTCLLFENEWFRPFKCAFLPYYTLTVLNFAICMLVFFLYIMFIFLLQVIIFYFYFRQDWSEEVRLFPGCKARSDLNAEHHPPVSLYFTLCSLPNFGCIVSLVVYNYKWCFFQFLITCSLWGKNAI